MDNNIGFIGLGTMGMHMARNLLKAKFNVTVYNRTFSKADKIAGEGAKSAKSPKEVAEQSTIIVTIVSDTPDVESVILGEKGVIEGVTRDSVVIDMSTISPEATRKIAHCLSEKGCHMLDAPVSGGEQGAIDGILSIMVGGGEKIFERCRPIFEAMGKSIVHVGTNGMGQTVKLMNQILVAGNLNAVVEALVFAKKQGLDLDTAIDAIKGGAAGSWQFTNLAPRIVKRDFHPGFKVQLMQKDLKLVMEAAGELKIPLPITGLVQQMFTSLQTSTEGDNGTQALVKVLEKLSGVKVK
ncbi:MAG: NAD(P)-dependent oxidoreductase [Dehalococcoidia bacterium]|nr:MAG: NAD(P)-dependent oxidoreductase [Dehalococcoidia bacterium]